MLDRECRRQFVQRVDADRVQELVSPARAAMIATAFTAGFLRGTRRVAPRAACPIVALIHQRLVLRQVTFSDRRFCLMIRILHVFPHHLARSSCVVFHSWCITAVRGSILL